MIRRPLDHPDQRFTSAALRDLVDEIAGTKAAAVRVALGVNLVGCGRHFPDFRAAEKAADDGISVAPILREIGSYLDRFVASQTLRITHGISHAPHGEDTSTR